MGGGGGGGNERVVDENVELAARQLRDFVVAGLDAILFGDIQSESGHADGGHFGQHSRVAGRRDDVHPWSTSARLFHTYGDELAGVLCIPLAWNSMHSAWPIPPGVQLKDEVSN